MLTPPPGFHRSQNEDSDKMLYFLIPCTAQNSIKMELISITFVCVCVTGSGITPVSAKEEPPTKKTYLRGLD